MGRLPEQVIESRIIHIRGRKVMLDSDLARLYGVTNRHLKRQVRRNIDRFPEELMFQLTKKERDELVPNWHQFKRLKHSHSMPYAFTEHGICMLAGVLNSEAAIRISIHIIKAFVRLREFVYSYASLASKLAELEEKVGAHDSEIKLILRTIQEMLRPPRKSRRQIGFHAV